MNNLIDSYRILFLVLLVFAFDISDSQASWLIFHKHEFKGKIVDAETNKPLEGVVVVAIYMSNVWIGGPAGGDSKVLKAREALTDAEGFFSFPSNNKGDKL